jgi:sugar/nucleoside kinase (ribokinase family)
MKYNFITIGGATRDIAFFTDAGVLIDSQDNPFKLHQKLLGFEYGAKIRIDKFINLYGGGAANAAVNLSGLGFKTAALLEVGDDENGRAITKNLKDYKVATELVNINKKADSGSSFILITNSGERIIFTTRGVNDYLGLDKKRLVAINQSDNVYIASLTGDWLKVLRQIFKSNHKNIFWNPGSKQYSAGLKGLAPFLKKTYCLMINREEALSLILSDPSNIKRSHLFLENNNNLLELIKSYGPKIVVITNGDKGACFYDGENFYHQKITKEKKHLDTTGIGDVFNSTFSAGLLFYKGDIVKAAQLASKNAAHKIAYLGAQNGLLTKKELMK